MRVVASYVAGILTLMMILASGGAWTTSTEARLEPVVLPASLASLPYNGDIPEPSPVETAPLPPGCVLAIEGADCAVTVVAGGLDVPRDAWDLVPDEVVRVSDWRPLVAEFFEPRHVDRALRVIDCESDGNALAKNPRSTASGLFQHLASLWPERAAKAGWSGYDVYDPVANVAVGAWLVYEYGGWSHWYPSEGCWR